MPLPLKNLFPCLLGGAAMLAGAPAFADATLTSSDGRWVAVIESEGGAAGQCNGLRDVNAAAAHESFLANTKHYLRIGPAITFSLAETVRMENTFSLLSFANSQDVYTAVLRSNTHSGVIAIVHGEMVDGAAGGLRVSISLHDTDPTDQVLLLLNAQPFVYANLNVDGQMLNNVGSWSGDKFIQSANNTGTGNERWFRGRSPTGHASRYHSSMQDLLDGGLAALDGVTFGGPSDINTAMSFEAGGLGEGNVHTIAYAVGNENITIPANFGAPPAAGGVGISSADGRWGAIVRTGAGHPTFGSAGEISSVSDFNEPLNESEFVNEAMYWFSACTCLGFSGQPLRNQFQRIAFYYPTDNTSLVTAVLTSTNLEGLVLVIDAKMLSGPSGGLVVGMKFADTFDRGINIAPLVYADINADTATQNIGGFSGDHFWQSAGAGSAQRWFRPASFASYNSALPANLQLLLNLGIMNLPGNVYGGTGDIAAAFQFEPWPLAAGQTYVTGYALGGAGIDIPSNFVFPSVWFTCASDIAPAGGDGEVNIDDLLAVVSGWGMCAGGCDADIVPVYVGDGLVNIDDLLSVISGWGQCFAK